MSCLFIFIFVFSSMYRRYHYKDFLRMDLNASSLVSEVTANCPTKMACSQPLFRLLSVFVLSNINKIYTQQINVKTDPSSMRHQASINGSPPIRMAFKSKGLWSGNKNCAWIKILILKIGLRVVLTASRRLRALRTQLWTKCLG